MYWRLSYLSVLKNLMQCLLKEEVLNTYSQYIEISLWFDQYFLKTVRAHIISFLSVIWKILSLEFIMWDRVL